VGFDSEQAELAEKLRRALAAMDEWEPAKRLQYKIRLGVKNREARFTRDFGGEAVPEPDSVPELVIPDSEPKPLVRLLYVLKHADDICLDGPTARSITGGPSIPDLVRVLKDAVKAGYARRTGTAELRETDRDMVVGVQLTEPGLLYINRVLRLDEP
jgi:hypothetical protein